MLDGVPGRLGRVAEAAGRARRPGEEPPGHREPRLVAGGLEDRDRLGDVLLDRVGAPPFGARAQPDEKTDEGRARRVGGRARGLPDCLLEHG